MSLKPEVLDRLTECDVCGAVTRVAEIYDVRICLTCCYTTANVIITAVRIGIADTTKTLEGTQK